MGFVRFMRQGAHLQREFVALALSAAAYRPSLLDGEVIDDPPLLGRKRPVQFPVETERDAILLLHGLADTSQIWRMSAGDTSILANELMRRVDQECNLKIALGAVVEAVRNGRLKGMDGLPIANGEHIPAGHVELCAQAVRPESYLEMQRG